MSRSKRRAITPSGDSYVLGLCAANPNMLVPHWLIASYMYYVEDNPVLSDAAFDQIVTMLEQHWDQIEHRHKGLLNRELMKSGFYIGENEYPGLVKGAAASLRFHLETHRE